SPCSTPGSPDCVRDRRARLPRPSVTEEAGIRQSPAPACLCELLALQRPLRVLAEPAVLPDEPLRALRITAKLPIEPAHRHRCGRAAVGFTERAAVSDRQIGGRHRDVRDTLEV